MAAPMATAITDLPLPESKSPEAVGAYGAGLQAFRDANWGLAREDWRRAIALDPSLAVAHLRLALGLDRIECRAELERAVQGRASLSDRDKALLYAIEPFIARDPPDAPLGLERLRAATKRYPLDAELYKTLAHYEADPDAKLEAATRATELDPLYADAWQARSASLAVLGRMDESLAAADQCIEVSHGSADCLAERATKYGSLGRCADMEKDLRRALASSTSALADWYRFWGVALYALGRPDETVLEALAQAWARVPEEARRQDELLDRALIEQGRGDFTRAVALMEEANRLSGSNPNAELHENAGVLVYFLREMGRPQDAARVAEDYLKRVDGWRDSISAGGTMIMLIAMLHGGALSPREFSAKRAAWLERAKPAFGDDPGALWEQTYFFGFLETPEEANEALSALSALPRWATDPAKLNSFSLGEMYMLAGRTDDALPFLRREERSCYALGTLTHNRNSYYLGLALEQKGDKSGACNAYAAVLKRWGHAKPRSVTAEKARDRARALGCR
jgi:eukaryotic-like serine/threonine-protein kinase